MDKIENIEIIPGSTDNLVFTGKWWAIKDGVAYKVYQSEKSYMAMSCMGRMRAVIDKGKVIQWIYPMLGGGEYDLINIEQVQKWKEKIKLIENRVDV